MADRSDPHQGHEGSAARKFAAWKVAASAASAERVHAPVTTHRPLTLDVTDLGPVARACVELRPLTVFVGPSNTGKSWLATLAYALHRHFSPGPRGWLPWFRVGFEEAPTLPEGVRTHLDRIAERLAASRSRNAEQVEEHVELTPAVAVAIRLHLRHQGGAVGEEVERCFGVDAGRQLVRHGSPGRARILLRHAVEGISTSALHELTFGEQGWTFEPTIPDGLRIQGNRYRGLGDLLLPRHESESVEPYRIWNAIGVLAQEVLPSRRPAFYLPADRTGLMNAHSTVVSALIQSATMGGIRRTDPVPPLSGVRGDFLEQLVEMVSDRQRRLRRGDRKGLRRLGRHIEEGILGGAVRVGGLPGVAYPHFTYHPRGWGSGLPLTHASSMVSELAPVVLYLRHVVAPDDLLIIDEPESHLHPAMQVAFTRQIAEIVRAGVRIIVTTHSEWVLEELGNVVGRGRVADGSAEDTDAVSLDARDVGVWLFQPAAAGGGSTVKEIALDTDTGLYPSGFAAVAAALHNDWAAIADPRGDAE